jgi:mannosyltransferase
MRNYLKSAAANPLPWMLIFAALLRFPTLAAESLWYDETFTAFVAKLPMANFWPAVRGDVHPPLYYLIEWVNIRLLGSSEFAMRLPSAIFGLIAVYLIYRLTLVIGFERRVALMAGLFIAVFPAMIYYSQEARMYTLLLCCVLGAAWAAMERRWAYFGLCCLGAAYSQNLGVFYVAALGLMALFI